MLGGKEVALMLKANPESFIPLTRTRKKSSLFQRLTRSQPTDTADSKITALLVEMQPQAKMQMHYHEVPSFGYILEGTIRVQSESGDVKTFSKGDVVIEMVNKRHSGLNPGETVTKFIVFYMGTDDLENTVLD